jgi:hypothetical protein
LARTSYGVTTHSVTATGSNDNSKQVSVNAWNADHNKSETGMLGFTKQSATISTNAIAATGTLIEIQADGTLNSITPTDVNEFDLIYLIAKSTATSVTITHDASGGAGKIRLLSAANETLSTTSPLILMCRTIGSNKEFVQYGGGVVNSLNDIGDVNITSIADNDLLAYDNSTSKWINQSPSEAGIITADSTTTFTNKTIDADATGNNLTNIENANIKASAAIDATKIADGTVTSAEFQYINTLSSNAQTQLDGKQASLTFGISSGNVTKAGSGIVDNDFLRIDGTTMEGRSASEVLTDIGASPTAGSSSIVTTGALDSGSITSGFGAINNGASAITTTGTITGGQVTVDNMTMNANKIEVTNTDGNLQLDSDGTGVIEVLGNTNDGAITLNCTANSHGQTIKSQPHSEAQTNTMLLPKGASSTLVSLVSADTLTNKTLTSPVINVGSDADGDIYYRASGAFSRLAKGTAGKILTMNSGATAPEWASAASGSDTPWTEVHNFAGYYYDMTVQTKPANPSANNARFYVKEIDSNNDGLFCIIRKNGSDTQEVQIA